jgi:NodT family efflux transporter outer membrane factor (OMF) lipoprotein
VSFSASAETNAPTPDAWWRLYREPALDTLLNEAFAANYDLKAASANLAAARAILESVRVARFPSTQVSAGAIYGRDPTTDLVQELSGRRPFTYWIYDDLLDMSYEVDLFGHVRRSIEAARANAGAVAAERDALRVTVAAETARAYAEVCALGEQLGVAQHNLEVVSEAERITVARHDAGAGSDFDVVRAQALVAQARATLPPLRGERRAALFELTALLGRTPNAAPDSVEACAIAPHLSSLVPVGDGKLLLRRRPDVREAERQLAAASAEIGVATSDLYPRIRLTGFYGGVADQIGQLGTNNGLAWGIGPGISWSFPNLGGPLADIRRANAGTASALAHFDATVLQALKETEQALSRYRAELDHHQELLLLQAKSQRAFELARSQFTAGSVSNLDLLTSEQTLIAANALVAASDAEVAEDQIALFKALGGGWAVTSP